MGIKSFMGKRAKEETSSKTTVADYMTRNLITFGPDDLVLQVMESLIKNNISGGPVVNEKKQLLGIISEGDCVKQLNDSRYYNHPMEDKRVKDHMITNVDTIDGSMHVLDAASKFLESHHRRFPIVENGKLVGQISQRDVLKAALALKGQTW